MPYAVGWYYIDRDHIAFALSGRVPLRAEGVDTDLPVWGTGEWDWVGFDPVKHDFRSVSPREHPAVVDPAANVIAGWNNHTAPGWPESKSMWGLGPYHRVSLLRDPVTERRAPLDVAGVVRIHEAAALTDARARFIYPLLRQVVGPLEEEPTLESLLRDIDLWAGSGALRIDSEVRGQLDHGRAIILMDKLWPHVIRNVFGPITGNEVLDEAGGRANNLSSIDPPPSLVNGWLGYLSKDLRAVVGKPVARPLSRAYCSRAGRANCRELLIAALREAFRNAVAEYGSEPANWRCPVNCSTCYPLQFPSTGAAPSLPASTYQSRPNYEMVTSFR